MHECVIHTANWCDSHVCSSGPMAEKMIKEVTGHKSSKALALCERPTLVQKQALSKVLAGGSGTTSSTSFSEEVDKLRCKEIGAIVQMSEHHLHAKSALPAGLFSSRVSNCTINFAPKTINIGVGIGGAASTQEDEFDFWTIVSNMHCWTIREQWVYVSTTS